MRRPLHVTALAVLIGSTSMTQGQTPPPAAPPPACTTATHAQFDFWVGDWVVVRPDTGAELGRNTITKVSGGCALHEHWRGASGYEGHSLNAWDAKRAQWTQHWIGADGVVLRLAGGLRGGAMVLEGELPATAGGVQHQRITWTPRADGTVTQHWETSDDAGETWTTSFLGVYRRAG